MIKCTKKFKSQSRLDTAQKAAYEAAGRTFQLTSPQQLSAVLYEHLQLDTKHNIKVKETDKRHNKSTSESMVRFTFLTPTKYFSCTFSSTFRISNSTSFNLLFLPPSIS